MKNKRFLFEIAHPKHFHQFRHLIDYFSKDNKIKIIARDKDILLELIKNNGYKYVKYGFHGKSILTKILATPKILFDYIKVIFSFNPEYIISRSSPYATFISLFFKSKHIVFPDSEVVPLINKFVAPYSYLIITPNNFALNYGSKHKRVSSFFELSYLSPRVFKPNANVLKKVNLTSEDQFFFVRFVSWQANHDLGKQGFQDVEKIELVKYLLNFGKVLISGEKKLPQELLEYEIKLPPEYIHSLLYFATLYIGDSQTMATEAALLGTPSYRFNSFVGENDMSNFVVLEKEMGLLKNFSSFEELFDAIKKINDFKLLKKEWKRKKDKLCLDTIDINLESIKIIEELENKEI